MEKVVDRFVIYMKLVGLNDNKVTVAAGLSNGILGKAKTAHMIYQLKIYQNCYFVIGI
ncbi:hypothetical protein ACIXO6_02175 [Bacteroides fragilis]